MQSSVSLPVAQQGKRPLPQRAKVPVMRARVAPSTFITTASCTRRRWVASMAPASTGRPARCRAGRAHSLASG